MQSKSWQTKILFVATAIAITVYLTWRAVYTLPFSYGLPSFITGLLLLICEIVAGFEALEQYLNMVKFQEPEMPRIPAEMYPDVDIFVATHNEGPDVLFKTLNGCTFLKYPDPRRIHVHLCDDNNRPEMRELAERLGVNYHGLTGNTQAKAGNINNALAKTRAPLCVIFDADMIPRSEFLMETVPYFMLPYMKKDESGVWVRRTAEEIDPDYHIGFIQTPQSFYNADLFQYNLYAEERVPNEQDYFFREINIGRNRNNTPLFAGSNAVMSRRALLEVGGLAADTITEDFETGIRIQEKGYTTYAVAKPLAHGLAPHSIPSLLAQRERWGRGCVQSLRNVKLFRSGLDWSSKMSYFACMIYWWTFFRRFVYIAAPILSVLFHFHVVVATLPQLLVFWLPYYVMNSWALKKLSGNTRNQHWNNLIDTTMFPYLIVPIALETVGIRKRRFVVTKKRREEKKTSSFTFALPHLLLTIVSAVSLVIAVTYMIRTATLYNAIIVFWLIVNGKNLVLSVFFMSGRDNFRKTERFAAALPVEIRLRGKAYYGVTSDISEAGMAVNFDFPVYLPDDAQFDLSISHADRYQARMLCTVVHVEPSRDKGKWSYSLRVAEIDETNLRQYMQVVYDRKHTLPDQISSTLTVLDDFSLNVSRRISESYKRVIRKLPRIVLEIPVTLSDGRKALLKDFNYKYAWISGGDLPTDDFSVEPSPDLVILLAPIPEVRYDEELRGRLYQVRNLDALLANDMLEKFLARRGRQQASPGEPPGKTITRVKVAMGGTLPPSRESTRLHSTKPAV